MKDSIIQRPTDWLPANLAGTKSDSYEPLFTGILFQFYKVVRREGRNQMTTARRYVGFEIFPLNPADSNY